MKRGLGVVVVALLVLLPSPGAGQILRADSAFVAGDFAQARTLYEQVLAVDSLNERALWRLALLDSWDNHVDRSLQRFARVRRLDPANTDLMIAHARVLSWAGRTAEAVALYDTALTRDSSRVDALSGRAQSVAWAGDLERAEGLWRKALAGHPDDATLLVGLAQTLYWKGEPGLARAYVDRARAAAPGDASVRDLEKILRAAVRPDFGTSFTGAGDSDNETFYSQDLWLSGALFGDTRATMTAGWRRSADAIHNSSSYGLSGVVAVPASPTVGIRAGLGARYLNAAKTDHTPLSGQLGVSWQPAPFASLGLGYSHATFDETANLIDAGLKMDDVELSADLDPKPTISVSAGGGATWFSDANRRFSGVLAVLGGLGHGVSAGMYGRMLGYRGQRPGLYFAPNRFTVAEARAIYNLRRGGWGLRADGGVGSQQINPMSGTTGPWLFEWHLAATLSHSWNAGEITLQGLYTNSAGSNTVGAFRYHAITLGFHQGL
ncbi:MAG TPA: tetratricopeptide repeat protein [Gemmatimonadales bacterium]|nr:tetratricopeptide repeat protein [Gemmatimonadales bacterium]